MAFTFQNLKQNNAHIFVCYEQPVFPHEFSDRNNASRNHSTQKDDEDTTEIGQTELSVVVGSAAL